MLTSGVRQPSQHLCYASDAACVKVFRVETGATHLQ